MKRFGTVAAILADAALITCAVLAAVCAIPSAFSVPFSIGMLVWICALAAVLLSGWMHLPRVGVAFGAVFLLGTVAYGIFCRQAITDGARYLWYHVLNPLSTDFSFLPVPAPIEEIADPEAAVTALLTVAAAVFGLLIAFALIRGKLLLLTVLLPLPPYLLSLIYTNQPPERWTALLLILYCAGALVGHSLRKGNAKQRGLLTAIVIPLMLALALLMPQLVPEERYTPIPFEQRQQMLGRTVGEVRDVMLSWFRSNPKNVDLDDEGERIESEETAFSLKVSAAGEYLLRTHSYGHYENSRWMSAADYKGEWRSMSALGKGQGGTKLRFSIRDAYSGERLVPYGFTEDPEVEIGETFVHAQGRTAYTWAALLSPNPYAPHSVEAEESAYLSYASEQYTMPEGEQKTALREILSSVGIGRSSDAYATALSVAAFVRGSGAYTLTPGDTPAGIDFVQYFLTQSHKGYCVHFASATTALLQALDIPARYTVGYHVTVPLGDVWTDVPESAAHAWAEVYVAGVGWVPIESTAGFGGALTNQQGGSSFTAPTVTLQPTATPTPTPAENTQTTVTPPALPKANETPDPGTPTPEPKDVKEGTPLYLNIDAETIVTEEPPRRISAWWLLLLLIPVSTAGWLAFGSVVRKRRKHAFLQKNAKKAILEMSRYFARLERCGAAADPDLQEWTEEAAYSNHAMTRERRELYRRVVNAQNMLYRDAPLKRIIARWILLVI